MQAIAAAVLSTWREHDLHRVIHEHDRKAVDATDAARALVFELLVFSPDEGSRDLFNACARLGRLLGECGASPSLAVSTIDGLLAALAFCKVAHPTARVPAARAALAEGYVATVRETAATAALVAWEYPACAVRVDDRTVAITARYPSEDGEALAEWSARVALGASRDGIKEAIVEGTDPARSEIVAALSLVGIAERTDKKEGGRSWLRLPFFRS